MVQYFSVEGYFFRYVFALCVYANSIMQLEVVIYCQLSFKKIAVTGDCYARDVAD